MELSVIVFVTTCIAAVMRIFRQPLVVGYILSGIIVGPYVLDLLHSMEYIELFSEIGISILLFIVGLHLNPETIKETGRTSVLVGIGQVLLTGIGGYFILQYLGFEMQTSIIGAVALTFSSTIIALKFLSDKGDLNKLYAKMAIGILLVEDIVATIALMVISILGNGEGANGIGLGATLTTLLIKGVVAISILYLISKYILPKLAGYLAHSQELLFLFSISWGLGLASIFNYLGFSIEIGALIAGVTLSVSTYAYEIGSRMKPLRDFFIVLFFVMLGSNIVFTDIQTMFVPVIILSVLIIFIKPLVIQVLMNLVGFRSRTGSLTAATLTQISEFSLILMTLAYSFGLVSQRLVSLIGMVGIVTIAISTYIMMNIERVYPTLKKMVKLLEIRKKAHREPRLHGEGVDMVIFGYDRVGFDFVLAAQRLGAPYLVVDFNPKSIKRLQDHNIPFRFGDAEDIEFLNEISLGQSKIVVSTIPDFKANLLLLRTYRKQNETGIIVLISHDIKEARELYLNGATYVIMPHYLGAHHASNMIVEYGFNIAQFEKERNKHLIHLAHREQVSG